MSAWRFPQARIQIFAKAPIPGLVKTRLVPAISAEQAAKLHADLVRKTLHMAVNAGLCPVELWCSPAKTNGFFEDCARDYGVSLWEQAGDDLGARMAHAFCTGFQHARPIVLIGTDCPDLNAQDLAAALDILDGDYDTVLGPAEDGGYYLVGLRQAIPGLFTGISWGTSAVFDETLARLRAAGVRWQTLRERWDVDRPADLERLAGAGIQDNDCEAIEATFDRPLP
jgi:hypothetical protein